VERRASRPPFVWNWAERGPEASVLILEIGKTGEGHGFSRAANGGRMLALAAEVHTRVNRIASAAEADILLAAVRHE
jgi:hypothetical protein